MTKNEIFDVIILTGRPASGKSEILDYLKKLDDRERAKRFHIGSIEEIDDFIYVWEMFEEDEIFSKYGKPRVYTDDKLYFKDDFLWTFLIEKINLAFSKKIRRDPVLKDKTIIIEFSRGGEDAYKKAFSTLSEEILKRASIVYIKVSYEESLRKNRRRFKPEEADSILYHSLPDEKMEYYYKIDDWDKIAPELDGYLEIKGYKIPYAVLVNEPEVTDDPKKLASPLEDLFNRLWKRDIER